MHAPLRPFPNIPCSGEEPGMMHGIARHVSDEGCQLAISGPVPRTGSRLAMVMGPGSRITGTVTWVVDDRVGFAFDAKLPPAMVIELATHLGLLKATRLLPDPLPNPLPA